MVMPSKKGRKRDLNFLKYLGHGDSCSDGYLIKNLSDIPYVSHIAWSDYFLRHKNCIARIKSCIFKFPSEFLFFPHCSMKSPTTICLFYSLPFRDL